MLLIRCPWCGERDEIEFRYGGAAHVAYPADPDALDDADVEPLPLLPRQPDGPVRRALGAHRGLPALVQRRARHRRRTRVTGSYLPGERPEHAR